MLLPFVIPNTVRNLAEKRKEILRFALNDKVGELRITNYKLRITNAALCHSEHSEESRGEEERDSSLRALNDKVGE